MKGLFITGTDTGIGKTHFTLACIRALQQASQKVVAMKPIASGAEMIDGRLRNEDALQVQQALNHAVDYELINPYCFAAPVSPHIAATQSGVEIALPTISHTWQSLAKDADYGLVEAVGGWLAPLSDKLSVADLAMELSLPVVMVVGMRLGCLNHAMLTAQSISASGLTLAGWVANTIEPDLLAMDEQISYLTQQLGMPPCVTLHYQSPSSIDYSSLPF